jgi:hypothetical protein
MTTGTNFFFSCRLVEMSDVVVVCASCSVWRMENGFSDIKFGVIVFVWHLTWDLAYFFGYEKESFVAIFTQYCLMFTHFFMYPQVVEWCPWLVFSPPFFKSCKFTNVVCWCPGGYEMSDSSCYVLVEQKGLTQSDEQVIDSDGSFRADDTLFVCILY